MWERGVAACYTATASVSRKQPSVEVDFISLEARLRVIRSLQLPLPSASVHGSKTTCLGDLEG